MRLSGRTKYFGALLTSTNATTELAFPFISETQELEASLVKDFVTPNQDSIFRFVIKMSDYDESRPQNLL